MGWEDIINGIFETFGGFFIFCSLQKLKHDKRVAGISWLHMAFFTAWGYWNIIYYAQLQQWFSWIGGILLVLTNTAYLAMLIYYSHFPGGKDAADARQHLPAD